ncbi:hypothetical protein KCU98_g22, partial [Aureobasidium melanogenum]
MCISIASTPSVLVPPHLRQEGLAKKIGLETATDTFRGPYAVKSGRSEPKQATECLGGNEQNIAALQLSGLKELFGWKEQSIQESILCPYNEIRRGCELPVHFPVADIADAATKIKVALAEGNRFGVTVRDLHVVACEDQDVVLFGCIGTEVRTAAPHECNVRGEHSLDFAFANTVGDGEVGGRRSDFLALKGIC